MEITDVKVTLRHDEKLKAFVTFTIDNCFVIRGLKIIQGARGVFVAMPNRRIPDGRYQDIVHPISARARKLMEEVILEEYYRVLGGGEGGVEEAGIPCPVRPGPGPLHGKEIRELPVEWQGLFEGPEPCF